MGEIKKRFGLIQQEIPNTGDVIIIWYAVKGLKYSRETIEAAFDLIVERPQYEKKDKSELIDYLYKASHDNVDPYKIRIPQD